MDNRFIFSGFGDEISPDFQTQLSEMKKLGLDHIEVRGVNGKSAASLHAAEAEQVKKTLDAFGFKVSAVGSPIGKIKLSDDFGEHVKLFENCLDVADILGTKLIRIFSFYIPEPENWQKYRFDVLYRLEKLLEIASRRGFVLCHENEKDIYGESPKACLDLLEYFGGKMRAVFDHANFINGGFEPYPDAYEMLRNYIEYVHIKDAAPDGIYPAGQGTGRIPETLQALCDCGWQGVLSIEPHLTVFPGLEALENSEENRVFIKNKFATPVAAFTVAAEALRNIVNSLQDRA